MILHPGGVELGTVSCIFAFRGDIRGTESVLNSDPLNLLVGQKRHFLGRPDVAHVLEVALGEDKVDFLQRSASRLRVEEVDDGEEARVDDGEEQVSSPTNTADHDGGHHDNEEIEQPIRARGERVGLGTSLDRTDLSRIQPRQG